MSTSRSTGSNGSRRRTKPSTELDQNTPMTTIDVDASVPVESEVPPAPEEPYQAPVINIPIPAEPVVAETPAAEAAPEVPTAAIQVAAAPALPEKRPPSGLQVRRASGLPLGRPIAAASPIFQDCAHYGRNRPIASNQTEDLNKMLGYLD